MDAFDWDDANIEHIARHSITPAEVEQVFLNNPEEKGRDNDRGEERFFVEGKDDAGQILIVIATMRDGKIRPITAHRVHSRQLRQRRRT